MLMLQKLFVNLYGLMIMEEGLKGFHQNLN